ncbi:MAG: DUF2059 domain-containing protein [Candidatus Omnitrophota bacterium]
MRKIILGLGILFLACPFVFGDTVYLKNGRKLEGTITQKTETAVKINVRGIDLTYYQDEIERIEQSAASAPIEPKPFTSYPSGLKDSRPQDFGSPQPLVPLESKGLQPFSSGDQAESQVRKKGLVLELIEASGTRDGLNSMLSEIMAQANEEEKAMLRQVIDINEILLAVVPVYEKYFSQDELETIVQFYKSSAGKKFMQFAPQIMEESANKVTEHIQNKVGALIPETTP